MKDYELEEVRNKIKNYESFDEFDRLLLRFINVKNKAAVKEFYTYSTATEEVWTAYKYFKSDETINLIEKQIISIDDLINELKQYDLSKYKRIIIRLDNYTYRDIEKLKKLNIDFYVVLNGDKGLCTLDEFINMRDFFDFFRKEYESYNLSELEKVALCYDYTKFFLYNIEENDARTESRSIAKSLSTGNIVCEGYTRLFCQLLYELNIDSYLMYVNEGYDKNRKHVRPIVFIYDEKYNLKDYYLFDPTWDSYKTDLDSKYSTVKYDYFLINANDYGMYFPYEGLDKLFEYMTEERKSIKLGKSYNDYVHFNLPQDKFDSLIRRVKRIEGYSKEQIEEYLSDVKRLKLK